MTSVMMITYRSVAFIIFTVLTISPASAQIVDLPGAVDPGRISGNSNLKEKPSRHLDSPVAKTKSVMTVPAGMEDVRFVLHALNVNGMMAYGPEEVAPIYNSFLGQEISVAQLFEIMNNLQQKYLDDGYALTKVVIPNQNIEEGNVTLAVLEGHVSEVEVSADVKRTPAIEDAVNQIAEMRPLNVKKLERIMLVLNDMPDGSVGAVLASPNNPRSDDPGGVRLILQSNPRIESLGSVGLDNHSSVFNGPLQTYVNLRGTSVLIDHSELSLTMLTAIPFAEQKLGRVAYNFPVFGASGTKIEFSGSKALTQPGSSLSLLDIRGSSESLEANISYPVIRQRDMTLLIDGGLEWKNSRTKILGDELFDDRIRIGKAGANFNFTDDWAGYSVVDLHYAQGLDILGARESGSVDLSRLNGKSDFQKFNFYAARLQALPAKFQFFGIIQGQYSFDPLLSSEEFGFGGGQMGRGYDASEITGDHGIAATLELRYNDTASFFNTTFGIRPYVFYDVGKVWNIDPGSKNKLSAASAGGGIRFDHDAGWTTDLNFAAPLTRSAENEPKYQNDVGGRILFSVSRSF